jgi:GTPase KRas protein
LVYSISSRSTFERVERFRDQITRVKGTEDVPMMLVGNKCDRITEREVSREEGMNMARKLRCEFIESSAKTCVNVERAFYTVVRMIRANRDGGRYSRKKKKGINIRIKKPKRPNPIIFLRKKKKIFSRLLS